MQRLTKTDKRVIDAFIDHRSDESRKLSTNGHSLQGNWMGGSNLGRGIAYWLNDEIHIDAPVGRSVQLVQRAVRKAAGLTRRVPNIWPEYKQGLTKRDPVKKKRLHYWVGLIKGEGHVRKVFSSRVRPTETSHPQYGAVIGPFAHKWEAESMTSPYATRPSRDPKPSKAVMALAKKYAKARQRRNQS
jgi:hypothetical protein